MLYGGSERMFLPGLKIVKLPAGFPLATARVTGIQWSWQKVCGMFIYIKQRVELSVFYNAKQVVVFPLLIAGKIKVNGGIADLPQGHVGDGELNLRI